MKRIVVLSSVIMLSIVHVFAQQKVDLETVAALKVRPGNVAVNHEARVFATIHPLGNAKIQLVEITGEKSYKAFPDESYQNTTAQASDDKLDTPLGIRIDNNNVLWIIDMGLNLGKTRLFGFDIDTKKEVFRFDFPESIAPKGSFIQDLAVDEIHGWVYLADIANPGIIALNTKTKAVRRFADQTLQSEDIDMIIDGKVIHFGGSPARVAVNPITLSADRNNLYYGAMNGTKWYQVSARLFRNGASDQTLSKAIKLKGAKPISDGAATDKKGNHYFTNIPDQGIDVLTSDGMLKPLYRSREIDWADNVALDGKGWIYIIVNQLHKTPAFTGKDDQGVPPYYIYRIKKALK